jgi:hypothetical protein
MNADPPYPHMPPAIKVWEAVPTVQAHGQKGRFFGGYEMQRAASQRPDSSPERSYTHTEGEDDTGDFEEER